MIRPLHTGWSLSGPDGIRVPATVPGCVHTDLLAGGHIPDPFVDDNEALLGWIGRSDWVYETTFEWEPDGSQRVDLVCDGLDTVAMLILNGVELGRTANMHRGYRFEVQHALRAGRNTLRIEFASAYAYAEALRDCLGPRPNAYPEPFNFIRKMACNFGWDWGPTLVTAGIWQPIGLHSWSVARLAQVRPLVTVDGDVGVVEVQVELDRAGDAAVRLTAAVAGVKAGVEVPAGARDAVVRLRVRDPELWWPRGYGSQRRYPLDVVLETVAGEELDSWRRRIGFRTVRLDTAPDSDGTPFTLVVNGVPVFVRGANWIPDDTFPHRVTRSRYAQRLGQAAGANMNLLRVWGGGRYESEDFYELADIMGLLVAQDFLFACAAYPEEEPLRSEIEAEARYQVVRLAPHPSLALWIGNNENLWGFEDWQWREELDDRTWGAGYYHDLLPSVVSTLDPTRPYWPGSPYSGRPDLHPNEPGHGGMHIWDVWNREDYTKYRAYRPRFVAEFGFQAPPVYRTIREAISDEPLAPDSPGMLHHQKAEGGQIKLARGLAAHLPEPVDFADWHYLTQVNQARAVQLGIEHFRSLRPLCMGSIMWQLNDCWPVTSWSAVDSRSRRKPLWYALRRAYADRLLTVQPDGDRLRLVAVNDGRDPWPVQAEVARLTLAGEPRAKATVSTVVRAGQAWSAELPADLAVPVDPLGELLLADAGSERAWWFFAEDRTLPYPPAAFSAVVEPAGVGVRVTVTAGTVLRDLTLYPDRLDPAATVDDALITLLPGESVTFTVHSTAELDPAALTSKPVLRCVNDVGYRMT